MLSVVLAILCLALAGAEERVALRRCTNRPEGICVDYTRWSCPTGYLYSFSGCKFEEYCCYPKSSPKTTTTAKPTTKQPFVVSQGSTSSPSAQQCGNPTVNPHVKIVGGETTTIEAHPWQVLIRKNGYHHCGGSLVNDRWIVTAAHCLQGHSGLDILVGSTSTRRYSRSQVISIAGQIIHSQYKSKGIDLALIKLSKSVNLKSAKTRAVCLASSANNFDAQTCIASGWGTTSENGYASTTLRHVEQPIVSTSLCKYYMGYVNPAMVCAGHVAGGKDSCQGDSGGPLICKGKNGSWMLAGVVSHGIGCARPKKFGFYTDVAQYRSWIESRIAQNS